MVVNELVWDNVLMTEKQSQKIITLPVNQFLSEKEIKYICKMVNIFYD